MRVRITPNPVFSPHPHKPFFPILSISWRNPSSFWVGLKRGGSHGEDWWEAVEPAHRPYTQQASREHI